MASSFEAFRARLEAAFQKRGARAEFVRKSEIPQSALQRWLNQEGEPALSSVDRAAEALGYPSAWEMLRPDTPERSLAERIDELKAAVTQPHAPTPAHAYLFALAARLDEKKAADFAAEIRAYLEGRGISLEGIHEPVESAKKAR